MPENLRDRISQKLTTDDLHKLRAMRRRIGDAFPICDDAEACGGNITGPRQALQMMDLQFAEIEKRFMPNVAGTAIDE